ncbi:[protein-PII] uridylyltransferase [Brachybacterium hainanense]|uniref:[protein-PII] uridylyltransferase n=1 Tax=Brachybacterium hainanense TaxID=1541174 RepID=A0ABV6RF02_9MICO
MPSEALPSRRLTHVLHAGFADPDAGPSRRTDHAALVDGWLIGLWDGAGAPASGAALAAIGSLGRRDLGPVSDLDLVLLVDPGRIGPEEAARLASALWYPVWDSGTSLDHALRSPEECERVAREDLRAAVSLLDLRLVAGDAELVRDASSRVRAQWRREARRRIGELVDLAEDRAQRYGPLAHSAEPNLKSDRGGLRDVTVIRALAESWLADHDHPVVDGAARVLSDARDALQAVTGKPTTRLGRADQDAVAALTGHGTADDHLAHLADAARAVSWELHRSIRAARAATAPGGAATRGTGTDRRPALTRLEHGVIVQSEEVSADLRSADPLRDLAAVAHAAASGLPLADATLERLAAAPPRPFAPAQRDMFVDVLAGAHIIEAYEALDVKGAVARWIPGWAGIRNRPQRSAVHRFTVDRHQIETVREAHRFLGAVSRPDLLLVAALLHDLGKRADARDHAAEGAPLAEAAARHLGFDEDDVAVIGTLVREHLTLVSLATGRDLADPSTLQELLAAVDHDPGTLELLRALTEADAIAAGPAAWSTWRSSLVDHLTGLARDALAGTAALPRLLLAPQRSVQEAVISAVRRGGGAHVLYPASTSEEAITQICLGAPDGPGVFAAMARVLARQRIEVRSAVVMTIDEVAVNSWWVPGTQADLPHPTALRAALDRELERRDQAAARVLELAPAPPPRTADDTPVVTLLPGASKEATVIQVNARNRPSLLADVAAEISVHQLLVRSAHVMTLGQRAVDVLYLTDQRGRPLDAPAIGRIIGGLMDAAAT